MYNSRATVSKSPCVAVNEQLIRETADLMVSSGLAEAGYKYLVVDGPLLACEELPSLVLIQNTLGFDICICLHTLTSRY